MLNKFVYFFYNINDIKYVLYIIQTNIVARCVKLQKKINLKLKHFYYIN